MKRILDDKIKKGRTLDDIFPVRLRELRETRGLSTTELGIKVNKTQQFISKLERGIKNGGARPSMETIEDIANALNVKISYFFENNPSIGTQMPLDVLLKNYDIEIRDWLTQEAKDAYIMFGKKAQDAGLTEEEVNSLSEEDLKSIAELLKRHKG